MAIPQCLIVQITPFLHMVRQRAAICIQVHTRQGAQRAQLVA